MPDALPVATLLINPLLCTLKPQSNRPLYSIIGTLAVNGWAVTFGTARRDLGRLPSPLAVPNVTAHPPTASRQCINFISFHVALQLPLHFKGLIRYWDRHQSTLVATKWEIKSCDVAKQATYQTCVFLKTYGKRRLPDLLFKEIFLVEKKNDWRVSEPFVVADWIEQLQAFLHPILQ